MSVSGLYVPVTGDKIVHLAALKGDQGRRMDDVELFPRRGGRVLIGVVAGSQRADFDAALLLTSLGNLNVFQICLHVH